MNEQLAFTLPGPDAARARRDASMAAVAAHADPSWSAAAFAFVRDMPAGSLFLAELVREHVDASGLVTSDRRALGPVMMALRRAGLIVPAGVRPANTSNRSLKPVWRRT